MGVASESAPRLEGSGLLSAAQARALVRLVEEAPSVVRRHQFFNWLQCHVHVLVPHVVATCGAYRRQPPGLVYDVLHSVVLPQEAMALLQPPGSSLVAALVQAWQAGRCRACALQLDAGTGARLGIDLTPLQQAGLRLLAVHGVTRPQRPGEIESVFLLGGTEAEAVDRVAARLELVLPHLHATWLRVQGMELELGPRPRPPPPSHAGSPLPITRRERQILEGVRAGRTNAQIGKSLGISALTVKNHVQHILRKLGAHTRAQAVALAAGPTWAPTQRDLTGPLEAASTAPDPGDRPQDPV